MGIKVGLRKGWITWGGINGVWLYNIFQTWPYNGHVNTTILCVTMSVNKKGLLLACAELSKIFINAFFIAVLPSICYFISAFDNFLQIWHSKSHSISKSPNDFFSMFDLGSVTMECIMLVYWHQIFLHFSLLVDFERQIWFSKVPIFILPLIKVLSSTLSFRVFPVVS